MRTTFEYSVNDGCTGLEKSSDRFFLVMLIDARQSEMLCPSGS